MKFSINRIKEKLSQRILEELAGGLADGKTIQDVYKKYPKTSQEDLDKQYEMGLKIEMEHTKDKDVASEITLDHLMENENYYTLLSRHVERDGEIITEKKKPPFEEEEDDEMPVEGQRTRDLENSDNLQKILTHEELVQLCQYVKLVYDYPVAQKLETHHEDTQTESNYYIGKIDQDIIVKKKKMIMKAGYYSVEKIVKTQPKIEPRIYTGGYDSGEECLEHLMNILIDIENASSDTRVSFHKIDQRLD